MTPSERNHYAKLRLPRDATAEEIRHAYFEAARRLHPDTNPDPNATNLFIEIQEAYEILSNIERRVQYDQELGITDSITPEISYNVTYSRPALICSDEPQLVYALIEMICTAQVPVSSMPSLNLCLVLDRSTSMQGARMDMVKTNAINLLRQLRPNDAISVVSFSDRAEVIIPATQNIDLHKMEAKISLIQAGGSTEIYQGMQAGVREMRRFLSSTRINHLILLTDGRTYGDEEACIQLAEQLSLEGITITGLGIGHEWNDKFMDKMTSLSGGTSMYISSPKELSRFFEQKLNNIAKVYAEHVTLDLEFGDNVELNYAFRLQPELGPLPTENQIALGSILYSKSSSVVLEFLVKQSSEPTAGLTMARGRILMDIPNRKIPTTRIMVNLARPVSEQPMMQPPPPSILQAMSRLTLYRMQEKAQREVAEGQVENATRTLQHMATHLLSQGERELAHTVLVEADHLQKNRRFSDEGDKRIKYGTRALLLPSGMETRK